MEQHLILATEGLRLNVRKGQRITVTDVEGGQVADFFAELSGTHEEYLSPAVTIDCNESLHVGVGTALYSNHYRPMFQVSADDVECHDLLFPACSRKMYDHFYGNGDSHPNCLDNLNRALGTAHSIIQPLNLFMHTEIAPSGKITIQPPRSKAGDSITLTALEDCAVAISACSVSENTTNAGRCTSILVRVEEENSHS